MRFKMNKDLKSMLTEAKKLGGDKAMSLVFQAYTQGMMVVGEIASEMRYDLAKEFETFNPS
jgi:hypothetical protein